MNLDIEDEDIMEEDIDYQDENEENFDNDLQESFNDYAVLKNYGSFSELKTNHQMPPGMYFDEDYFADLVLNHYLPSLETDKNGRLISRDAELEKEILANILLIVNAVINKYGIWRFEKFEVLQSEGVSECWRSLPTFDPSRGKKFFNFLSLVAKYHLINLTKKDKEQREAADISIQPDLESRQYVKDNFFFEDLEAALFDIIDENFSDDKEKHDKYIDLASILMEYIKENKMIVGKNDLFATFREYGYKTNDYKKFIEDIRPFKDSLYELA